MKKSYQKLVAYQKAEDLVALIYRITESYPSEEKFGLISQMRRAAISILANIAEGYTRYGDKETSRFLYISLGSLAEVEAYLNLSLRLNFLKKNDYERCYQLKDETGKVLFGLIKSLNKPAACSMVLGA